jgi:cytochrome c oxidase subunit 2
MDKFEKWAIFTTVGVLVIFVIALLFSIRQYNTNLPTCIPYDEGYETAGVQQLDDSTFQVNLVAGMWNYDPEILYLPVGAEVDFYLSTKDVVHGFNVPDKNINMMAVPGAINKQTFTFDKPGVFQAVCHEYCGTGHQHMRMEIVVNYPNE